MIVLDTSGVLAWLDGSQRHHQRVRTVMSGRTDRLLLSPFVLAELDYLLATRVGPRAQQALLAEVAEGAMSLEPFGAAEIRACLAVLERYSDLDIGLADASIVFLAERFKTDFILTLDERHFRALRTGSGNRLHLLPADA